MRIIVANSGGLLYVDEEEKTVHYVYTSVKSHLFSATIYRSRFSTAELDLHLGLLILTYLDFNNFKYSLVKATAGKNVRFDPVHLATTPIFGHASRASRVAQRLLQKYTASDQTQSPERMIQEAVGSANQAEKEIELGYPFLRYAGAFWVDHLEMISSESDPKLWNLFTRLMTDDNVMAERPWDERETATSSEPLHDTARILDWALQNQKSSLVMYLLVLHSETVSEAQKLRITTTATRGNLVRFIKILVKEPSTLLVSAAFAHAAKIGCLESVDLCIKHGISPDDRLNSGGSTPLQLAAAGGHHEVVNRLLDAKADVDALEYGGLTALQLAARGGHLEVVNRLLDAKADVDALGYGRLTALQLAAGGGHLEVVNRLLDAKADVDAAAGFDRRTALQEAAEGGHLEVVNRLLDAKADLDTAVGYDECMALQVAAEGGHLEVVNRLLDAKADVDAITGHGGLTALRAAAGGGHLEVVNRLLDAKADVDALAYDGRTALQAAIAGGHSAIAEQLRTAGARC